MMKLITKESTKSMVILSGENEYSYIWLAKQRPNNKRQNRILLLNAKKRNLRSNESPTDVTNDSDIIPRHEVKIYAI